MLGSTIYEGENRFLKSEYDYSALHRFLHFPPSKELPNGWINSIENFLLPSMSELAIRYQFRNYPISKTNSKEHKIELSSECNFTGETIFELLKNCSDAVVFLVSINSPFDNKKSNEFLNYAFYNTLIEMAVKNLKENIINSYDLTSSSLTPRFTPDYCGWPIYDQKGILGLLEPKKIGVNLTPDYMLDPIYSTTGVYGIKKKTKHREDLPCYDCTSITCYLHNEFHPLKIK